MFISISIFAVILFFVGLLLLLKSFIGLRQAASGSVQASVAMKALNDSLMQREGEVQSCKKAIEQDKAEYERLREELNQARLAIAQKEDTLRIKEGQAATLQNELGLKEGEVSTMQQRIQALTEELAILQAQSMDTSGLQEQLKAKDINIQQLTAQFERLTADTQKIPALSEELGAKDKQIQALTSELQNITNGVKGYEDKISKLPELTLGIDALQRNLDEEGRAMHELKLRMQENQMKIKLLNDKSKGTVEAVALFAQGKEFDEFRKSIHMDETIQGYEDQIKVLRIEALELKKKLKG